jgi:YD repeat-containing protein
LLATQGDGQEHPIIVVEPDGTLVYYGYDNEGRVVDMTVRQPGGPGFEYHSDDGNNWQETIFASPYRGNLTVKGTIEVASDGTRTIRLGHNGMWNDFHTVIHCPDGSETETDEYGRIIRVEPIGIQSAQSA